MNLKGRVQRAEDRFGSTEFEPIKVVTRHIYRPSKDGPFNMGPRCAFVVGSPGRLWREYGETAIEFERRVNAIADEVNG